MPSRDASLDANKIIYEEILSLVGKGERDKNDI